MSKQNSSTSNSKNSLLKVTVKFIVFCIILAAIFLKFISPQYSYSYSASLIDKIARLNSIDEPKIVLVGNSNLAFGIRSQRIEEALGMKVVNMGLNGGLGNAFHEEMAKENLNAGDIVVVCHPDFDGRSGDKVYAWSTIENHPELWGCVPNEHWYEMILAFPTYAKNCINLYLSGTGNSDPGETPYSRSAFNEYGDNVFSETHEWLYEFEETYAPGAPELDVVCLDRLNKLNAYVIEKGALLLVAGTPIAYKDTKPDANEFLEFQSTLESSLDCPVISDYLDYLYPYEYFFDAEWHLTNEGAIIRTDQLIEDLQNYLSAHF